MTDRSNREGFPRRPDKTLSRYAWARADDTWFQTVAILPDQILMARRKDGVLIPEYPDFQKLYIGDVTGEFLIQADHPFTVVSKKKVTLSGSGIIKVTVSDQ